MLILAGVMALAAPAQAQPAAAIAGAWHGVGLQAGPEGPQETWNIVLHIRSDRASRIEYPSLSCKGVLHETSRSGIEMEFREEITEGECITGGVINVRLVANRLFWFWRLPGGGDVDASAVLYRDQPIG
jgi:hypothetical protein